MKIKETAKNFWEKNKDVIIVGTSIVGVFALGMVYGTMLRDVQINLGIWATIAQNPEAPLKELPDILEAAVKK